MMINNSSNQMSRWFTQPLNRVKKNQKKTPARSAAFRLTPLTGNALHQCRWQCWPDKSPTLPCAPSSGRASACSSAGLHHGPSQTAAPVNYDSQLCYYVSTFFFYQINSSVIHISDMNIFSSLLKEAVTGYIL